jgi:aspartyl protease family protein
MVYGAWVLLILLLTFLFTRWLDYQHNPNRDLMLRHDPHGTSTVTLQRNRAGHYVASGLINGEPVVFLLDTGATHVALPAVLADRLGLVRGVASTSITANGRVRSWLTRLDELQLGSIVMRDVRASILPSMSGNEVLLGMSFLKHLELVQRDGQLMLSVPVK